MAGIATATQLTPRSSTTDISGNSSLTYPYSVLMDTAFDTEANVRASSGLPALGDDKDGARANSYRISIDDINPFRWDVEVTYASQSQGYSPISITGNNNRLLSLSYGSRSYSKTINTAYFVSNITSTQSPSKPDWTNKTVYDNNEQIVNTAKDQVVGVSDVIYSKIIRLTQIEDRTFSPDRIFKLLGKINAAALVVAGSPIPASEGVIVNFTPELKNASSNKTGYPNGKYWISSYEIEIMDGGWYQKVVNEGFKQLVGGDITKKEDIFNKNINADSENPDDKIQEPALLKEDGSLELTGANILFLIIWSKFGTSWDSANFVKER